MSRNNAVLSSSLLGSLYALYLIIYFSEGLLGGIGGGQTGIAVAEALLTPHMVLVVLAAVFNWIGFTGNRVWGSVAAAVLYTVAGLVFLLYFLNVLPMMILSFIGASASYRRSRTITEAPENRQ